MKDAVAKLGLRQVRNIALGFSLVSKHSKGACLGFPYDEFWASALATALAAQAAAAQVDPRSAGDAFTCGLLLTVGQLALATIFPTEYDSVLSGSQGQTLDDIRQQEHERFGIDHHALTTLMLQDWRLPPTCVEAVRTMLQPDGQDTSAMRLARVLHFAVQMGAMSIATIDQQLALLPELTRRGEAAGIPASRVYELGQTVMRAWQEWSSLFAITSRTLPSFANLEKWCADTKPVEAPADAQNANEEGQLTALVVESSTSDGDFIRRQLEVLGWRVLSATTGRGGLQTALEEQPHLLIAAADLPEFDGLALCRTLRLAKITRKMRVLLCVNQADDEHVVPALAAGADDCFTKPFRPKVVEARLRSLERLIRFGAEDDNEHAESLLLASNLDLTNQKLQEAAHTDDLTGLPNRRAADDRLDAAWSTNPSLTPLVCLFVDLDHFKKVNDTLGHDVGDAVLRDIASVQRRVLRQHDTICRWGGEEFLVIAAATDLTVGRAVAERLRAAIAAHDFDVKGLKLRVTASIGLAMRHAHMQHPEDLLKAADVALYAAKQAGRNRVVADADLSTTPLAS